MIIKSNDCLGFLIFLLVAFQTVQVRANEFKCPNTMDYFTNQISCGTFFCPEQLILPEELSKVEPFRYLLYRLPNGVRFLEVIVTSLNHTSLFQLTVNVGSIWDPQSEQGLAHLLQHMIFMGSQTYPGETAFMDFVQKHSGYTNAYTAPTETKYFFEIEKSVLSEAFHMVVAALKKPLLRKASLRKQINAVDEEYQLLKDRPTWETYTVWKKVVGAHGYELFSAGNHQTLQHILPYLNDTDLDSPSAELKNFHQKYYSSDRMVAAAFLKEHNESLINQLLVTLQGIPKRTENIEQKFTEFQPIVRINGSQHIVINHTLPNYHSLEIVLFPFVKIENILQPYIQDRENLVIYFKERIFQKDGIIDQLYESQSDMLTKISVEKFDIAPGLYPLIGFDIQLNAEHTINQSKNQIDEKVQQITEILLDSINSIQFDAKCFENLKVQKQKHYLLGRYKKQSNLQFMHTLTSNLLLYPWQKLLSQDFSLQLPQVIQQYPFTWKALVIERCSNCIPESQPADSYLIQPHLKTVYRLIQKNRQNSNKHHISSRMKKCNPNPYSQLLQQSQNGNDVKESKQPDPKWLLSEQKLSNIMASEPPSSTIKTHALAVSLYFREHFMKQEYSPFMQMLESFIRTNFRIRREANLASDIIDSTEFKVTVTYSSFILSVSATNDNALKTYFEAFLSIVFGGISQPDYFKAHSDLLKQLGEFYIQKKPWQVSQAVFSDLVCQGIPNLKTKIDILNNYTFLQFAKDYKDFIESRKIVNWAMVAPESIQKQYIAYFDSLDQKYIHQRVLTQKELPGKVYLQQLNSCNSKVVQIIVPQGQPSYVDIYVPIGQRNIRTWIITSLLAQYIQQPFFNQLRTNKKMAYALSAKATLKSLEDRAIGLRFFLASSNYNSKDIVSEIKKFVLQHFEKDITREQFEEVKLAVSNQLTKPFESTGEIIGYLKRLMRLNIGIYQDQILIDRSKWIRMHASVIEQTSLIQFNKAKASISGLMEQAIILRFDTKIPPNQSNNTSLSFEQFKQQKCAVVQRRDQPGIIKTDPIGFSDF